MKIILNQKDADFILGFIRADVRRLNSKLEELNKADSDLNKSLDKLKEKNNGEEDLLAQCISKAVLNISSETRTELKELQDGLIRCVELLTIGSEETE